MFIIGLVYFMFTSDPSGKGKRIVQNLEGQYKVETINSLIFYSKFNLWYGLSSFERRTFITDMAWCMLKANSDKSSSAPSTLEGHGKQGVELDFSISTHNTFDLIFFMYQDVVADVRRLFKYTSNRYAMLGK